MFLEEEGVVLCQEGDCLGEGGEGGAGQLVDGAPVHAGCFRGFEDEGGHLVDPQVTRGGLSDPKTGQLLL